MTRRLKDTMRIVGRARGARIRGRVNEKNGQGRIRYCIKVQQRAPYNGLYPRHNWRAYRKWSVWPILFNSREAAEAYLTNCFTFRGLHGHKMSASVHVIYLPRVKEEQAA